MDDAHRTRLRVGSPTPTALARINEGWKQKDVASSLGVSLKAVGKWMAAYRASGEDGLNSTPRTRPTPKLLSSREQAVLAWLAKSPRAFGYKTELWTTRRLAEVIQKRFGVRYLVDWLARRGYTPQKTENPSGRARQPGDRSLSRRGVAADQNQRLRFRE